MRTSYPALVTAPIPLSRREVVDIPELSRPGVVVYADPTFGEPGDCGHCALVGAVATVRIYGDPPPHSCHVDPVGVDEMCLPCAPTVLDRALSEQDEWSRHPIEVEVAA